VSEGVYSLRARRVPDDLRGMNAAANPAPHEPDYQEYG
jgi:hypothetical protein